MQIYLQFDRPVTDEELQTFRDLVRQRVKRIPLQYITGKAHFRNLDLDVGEGVLIPRPETEILVEKIIARLSQMNPPRQVLDFGTGSGCIALSIGKEVDSVFVTGLDFSEKALQFARINTIKNSILPDKIKWKMGNKLEELQGKFDILASNPPYIPSAEISGLQEEVRFEPRNALDGGEDGLDFYRMFSEKAGTILNPNGWLLVEIGYMQDKAIQNIFSQNPIWRNLSFYTDLAGKKRIFEAQLTN
jgi:release factor glutamine methyltransferase